MKKWTLGPKKKWKIVVSAEKEKAIQKHFNKQVLLFKRRALKLALEYDYPYVEAILEGAYFEMFNNLHKSVGDIRDGAESSFYKETLDKAFPEAALPNWKKNKAP